MIKMKKDMIDKLGEIEKAMVIARTRSSEEKKKIHNKGVITKFLLLFFLFSSDYCHSLLNLLLFL